MSQSRAATALETGSLWMQRFLIYGTPFLIVLYWVSKSSRMECIEAYKLAEESTDQECRNLEYEVTHLGNCALKIACTLQHEIWLQAKDIAWFGAARAWDVGTRLPIFGVTCAAVGWFAGTIRGWCGSRPPAANELEQGLLAADVRFFRSAASVENIELRMIRSFSHNRS